MYVNPLLFFRTSSRHTLTASHLHFTIPTKMPIRLLFPRSLPLFLHFRLQSTAADEPNITAIVNDLCRLLSDFRSPHHDLESALNPFSSVSPSIAEQVLKRCRHLPSPSYRFFIWSSSLPSFLHTPTSHFILLDILASARLFPLVWTLLADFHPHFSHSNAFRLLFQAYARASVPHYAIRAFLRMPDFGLKPSVDDLHHLIAALCRQGHVIPAQEFFHKCKDEFSVTQKTYTLLINGWALVRQPPAARQLFDEMLQRDDLGVDVAAYNSLMVALCRGGEVGEAHKLFLEMRRLHGLEPDAASYAVFIRAYCEGKDVNSALKVIEHMKMRDHTPNVFTYNAIIKLLCETEKAEEAYRLLDEMIERGARPDTWSYNAILSLHCKFQEVNRALRLLARMDRDSCLPDRHTYNMLLKMLIGIGRFDRVIEVWESMEKRGFFPSASSYAVMVHGLCKKKGKIEEACHYFEMMVDEGIPPYPSTCEVLRRELQRLGLGGKIEVLVGKMKRSTSCSIQELSNVMDGSRITAEHT